MNRLQVNKLLTALLVSALGMTAGMNSALARNPTSDPVTSQAVNSADGRISGANDISGPVGRSTPPPQSSTGSSTSGDNSSSGSSGVGGNSSGTSGNNSGRSGGGTPMELGNGMLNNGALGATMPGASGISDNSSGGSSVGTNVPGR